jgi:phosphatidylserine/phosphatidylglycerophosphate/cardiolipin synthase-like enzyme
MTRKANCPQPMDHNHRVIRKIGAVILLLLVAACSPGAQPSLPTWTTAPGLTTPSPEINWLEVYFTNPGAPLAADFEGGPDIRLAAAIDSARLSVDMAAYSLNLWSIRDALIHAHQRGVNVRLVMESDNMDTREVQDLQEAGISITGDQREGLMHNKFVVIDQNEVWSGSMNFTTSGAYKDNNNLVRIRSSQAAEDYTTEFSEMFTENLFGPDTRAVTPHPSLTINGIGVEIYFSPDDGVATKILGLLQSAQDSIEFMAYSFTSNELADAILQRAKEGVSVAGVMDDDQINSNLGTEYDRFMQAGLDVRRDGNAGQMHHKVIIIDHSIVITGSYNFSGSAEERNDENVVIIHDAGIAGQFDREFQRVYAQAQP